MIQGLIWVIGDATGRNGTATVHGHWHTDWHTNGSTESPYPYENAIVLFGHGPPWQSLPLPRGGAWVLSEPLP